MAILLRLSKNWTTGHGESTGTQWAILKLQHNYMSVPREMDSSDGHGSAL
jgi:hypothetical protein